MGDVDGMATLTLDDVTADSMTFDLYVQGGSGNSYENSDYLVVKFVGSSSTLELVNVTGATGSVTMEDSQITWGFGQVLVQH